MQRFNSFCLIHKALRGLMYDAALSLQQTDFTDAEETAAALDKVETVIYQLEQHARHEDDFMLPAIEAFEPAMVEYFEKEHVEDITLGNRLQALINIFRATHTEEEKVNCGSALNKAFRDFMVFNINHMAREEAEINNALWKHYTDAELLDLNKRLQATIPAEEKAFVFKWMMKCINKSEAIVMLKSIKQTAPFFVFESMFALTGTELPEHIRTQVQEAVMEYEMIY